MVEGLQDALLTRRPLDLPPKGADHIAGEPGRSAEGEEEPELFRRQVEGEVGRPFRPGAFPGDDQPVCRQHPRVLASPPEKSVREALLDAVNFLLPIEKCLDRPVDEVLVSPPPSGAPGQSVGDSCGARPDLGQRPDEAAFGERIRRPGGVPDRQPAVAVDLVEAVRG